MSNSKHETSKFSLKWILELYKRLWKPFDGFTLSRKDYWLFWLVVVLVPFIIFCIVGESMAKNPNLTFLLRVFCIIMAAYAIPTYITLWRAQDARLHDVGHSAWYRLWYLLPYIGWLVYFIALVSKGQADSRYKQKKTESKAKKLVREQIISKHLDSDHNHPSDSQQSENSEEYWSLTSFAYGKVKNTNIFKLWKKEQYDCQFGKCAICSKPMLDIKYSEVNHLRPKRKVGTNYSDNLILVHKECSEKRKPNSILNRPSGIKSNKYDKALDDKVYEITEEIRKDYPTKFPDDRFKKPNQN